MFWKLPKKINIEKMEVQCFLSNDGIVHLEGIAKIVGAPCLALFCVNMEMNPLLIMITNEIIINHYNFDFMGSIHYIYNKKLTLSFDNNKLNSLYIIEFSFVLGFGLKGNQLHGFILYNKILYEMNSVCQLTCSS